MTSSRFKAETCSLLDSKLMMLLPCQNSEAVHGGGRGGSICACTEGYVHAQKGYVHAQTVTRMHRRFRTCTEGRVHAHGEVQHKFGRTVW